MMLKVIVYAYAEKVYSCRRIAKALRENVNFMWIAGGHQPDFHTINDFRRNTLKEAVRAVLTKVLELLIEEGYVKMENYFVDGTKIGANANAHKVVWAKKTKHYKEKLQEKIKILLDEIEQVNEQENKEYGDADLEEMGGKGGINSEQVQKKVDELNAELKKQSEDKVLKKAVKRLEKEHLPRLQKYENTGASLIVPSYQMRRGHPWLVSRELWNEILEMKPPESPREFLNRHAKEIKYINMDTPSVLADLDTPEDYLKSCP